MVLKNNFKCIDALEIQQGALEYLFFFKNLLCMCFIKIGDG
jgi:hypothetical protein